MSESELTPTECSGPIATVTTTFTPPTDCTRYWSPPTTYTGEYWDYTLAASVYAYDIYFTQSATMAKCAPAEFTNYPDHCDSLRGLSLSASACPHNWATASTGVTDETTTLYCCPPNAPNFETSTSESYYPMACSGQRTDGPITYTYNSTFQVASGSTTRMSTIDTSGTTLINDAYFLPSPIVVQFQEGLPAATASLTPQSPTPTISSLLPQTGLSTGAKSRIGIGSALGVLALLGLGYAVYLWRRKKRRPQKQVSQEWAKAELSGEPMEAKEMPDDSRYIRPVEIYTDPAELAG
ncbi:hypothetical protein K402DRAFT_460856 [Aulographum hederae CBS 113979]|uniref:Uncharacterized protein n=1 Tax=Aulographum hederae CBS 113979 TaxID=1176131 RepID=A0A6G1HB30_9PEZI|nr:hypothetical protein K402DRAFT_460856 [Aulographum hederae CBS 113979]